MDINKYIDQPGPVTDRPHFVRESKSAGQVRDYEIYINHENYWILRTLVKAQSKQDSPTTKEQLVDSILTSYFDAEYPELRAFYKDRQQIDKQAIKAVAIRGPEAPK